MVNNVNKMGTMISSSDVTVTHEQTDSIHDSDFENISIPSESEERQRELVISVELDNENERKPKHWFVEWIEELSGIHGDPSWVEDKWNYLNRQRIQVLIHWDLFKDLVSENFNKLVKSIKLNWHEFQVKKRNEDGENERH